jgi:hypothetical protein
MVPVVRVVPDVVGINPDQILVSGSLEEAGAEYTLEHLGEEGEYVNSHRFYSITWPAWRKIEKNFSKMVGKGIDKRGFVIDNGS